VTFPPAADQPDPAGTFRITPNAGRLLLKKLDPEKGWRRRYSFIFEPRRLEDFAGMCHYH
jgi:hypothetical protein